MKKRILALLFGLVAAFLCACVSKTSTLNEKPGSELKTEESAIKSIGIYNKTGRIQKEEYYNTDGSLKYSLEYTYTDSGNLLTIKRKNSTSEFPKDIETCFYQGSLINRHFIYDSSGNLVEEYYWKYNSNGKLKSEKHVTRYRVGGNSIKESSEYSEYDTVTGLKKHTETNTQGYHSREEYEYDERGLCTKQTLYEGKEDETLSIYEIVLNYYDEANNKIGEIRRAADWTVKNRTIWQYDDTGNETLYALYDSDNMSDEHIVSRTERSYTKEGRIEREHNIDGSRGKTTDIYNEFDENGNNIKTTTNIYYSENDSNVIVTENQFDKYGTIIKSIDTGADGKKKTVYRCSCEYYNSGELRTKTVYYT